MQSVGGDGDKVCRDGDKVCRVWVVRVIRCAECGWRG